jgi:hypothetical protein
MEENKSISLLVLGTKEEKGEKEDCCLGTGVAKGYNTRLSIQQDKPIFFFFFMPLPF